MYERIMFRIVTAKAAFSKKWANINRQIGIKLKDETSKMKYLSMALIGAETGTLGSGSETAGKL